MTIRGLIARSTRRCGLLVSNSQVISADGVVANTSRGAHHLIVGFTITREFNL
jgi:hypothetical protein